MFILFVKKACLLKQIFRSIWYLSHSLSPFDHLPSEKLPPFSTLNEPNLGFFFWLTYVPSKILSPSFTPKVYNCPSQQGRHRSCTKEHAADLRPHLPRGTARPRTSAWRSSRGARWPPSWCEEGHETRFPLLPSPAQRGLFWRAASRGDGVVMERGVGAVGS
jgi:hypothetical protein